MHKQAKPSARTVLKPCPCCGGEARFETYHVEDGYIGHAAGDIICLGCGLRTISAPVDGHCGVEWGIEDFAARWNRRADGEETRSMIELKLMHVNDMQIDVRCQMEGSTDALLDELAAGMAHAIVRIADDLPVVDDIHDSLARVMTSKMIDMVQMELDMRSGAQDEPAEA